MKKINLRELYPDVYTTDFFVDVTEKVMETIRAAERAEAAYERKMYRYKAQYSLDCENGIENAVLLKPQTPEMVLEEKQFQEQIYTAVMKLPEKQAMRIYARYYLGMTVNEFAQDVHKNAVAHGWYDAPITFPEVAVMIHAEISEAVEEWRSGNPVIYGTCALSPENCKFSKICDNVGHPSGADTEGNCKPEGVAVELCDAVMRIMDFLAFMGVDIEAVLMAKHEYNKGREYRHGGKRA